MVTIIVLLILAAVAINLTIGDNGIFARAQEAVNKYEQAEVNEQDELNKIVNFIDDYMNGKNPGGPSGDYNTGTTVDEAKKQNDKPFEKDTTIKDDLQNEVRIPGGFHIAEDSATKVEDGVVIEDDVGNQFVWIPAKTGAGATIHTTLGDKTLVYQRTALDDQVATGEIDGETNSEKIQNSDSSVYYTESLQVDEETSVNANGGYYIGRYEAGDKVSTDAGKMRTLGDSPTNEIAIKQGQAPYNYMTYDNSKSLAEGMDSIRGYTGTTKMVSSYAWDTAINFIKIKTPDYDSNSPQGNYKDTTFTYANIGEKEKTQTKAKDNSTLVPTGQTIPVSNIYDMGGNCWERTTESVSTTGSPISCRGGDNSVVSGFSAGCRSNVNDVAFTYDSFRVTLFCSVEYVKNFV